MCDFNALLCGETDWRVTLILCCVKRLTDVSWCLQRWCRVTRRTRSMQRWRKWSVTSRVPLFGCRPRRNCEPEGVMRYTSLTRQTGQRPLPPADCLAETLAGRKRASGWMDEWLRAIGWWFFGSSGTLLRKVARWVKGVKSEATEVLSHRLCVSVGVGCNWGNRQLLCAVFWGRNNQTEREREKKLFTLAGKCGTMFSGQKIGSNLSGWGLCWNRSASVAFPGGGWKWLASLDTLWRRERFPPVLGTALLSKEKGITRNKRWLYSVPDVEWRRRLYAWYWCACTELFECVRLEIKMSMPTSLPLSPFPFLPHLYYSLWHPPPLPPPPDLTPISLSASSIYVDIVSWYSADNYGVRRVICI